MRERFLIGVLSGLIGILLGCGESTIGTQERQGELYVVNNTTAGCNFGGEHNAYIIVEWEGEEIRIPWNMKTDGTWSKVGAVKLTREPLPGGTEVDFTYYYNFIGTKTSMRLSEVFSSLGEKQTVIDGSITIEIYSTSWQPYYSVGNRITAFARVIKGQYNGTHLYPTP